jgi:hypothetical protein
MADTSSRVKYQLMQAEVQPLGEWDYAGEEGEGMDTERGLTEEEFEAQEKKRRRERRPVKVRRATKVTGRAD